MMYIASMYSRELLKGILKPLILKLLSDNGRMHGYEMVRTIKDWSGDKILVKEGSLYPTLHALTKDGLLTYEEEFIGKRVRKYYKISKAGKGQLKERKIEILDFVDTLSTMFNSKHVVT